MLQYSLCRKRCWAPGTGWAETSAQPGRADTPQCSAGGIERLQYLYWNKNITIYLLMAWDHWTPWVLGSPVCSDKSSAKNTKKHSTFSRKFYLSDSHRHVVNVCNIIIKAFRSYCDGVNSSWAGRYPRWVHQSTSLGQVSNLCTFLEFGHQDPFKAGIAAITLVWEQCAGHRATLWVGYWDLLSGTGGSQLVPCCVHTNRAQGTAGTRSGRALINVLLPHFDLLCFRSFGCTMKLMCRNHHIPGRVNIQVQCIASHPLFLLLSITQQSQALGCGGWKVEKWWKT